MVPPAAAQRETGPWERKTDKTQSVRGAARRPARPLPASPSTLPPAPGNMPPQSGPGIPQGGGSGQSRRRPGRPPPGSAAGRLGPTPSSPLRAPRTQIRTHRPVRRGLTPRPPLPPAAMTPHLARSGERRAGDSSGSLRPHLHLTPRTRPRAGRPPAARRACTRGRGAPPRGGGARKEGGRGPARPSPRATGCKSPQ
jgi:hypothetical protein